MTQKASLYKAVQIQDGDGPAISFLYNTAAGRVLLRLLIKTAVSKLAGSILSSPASRLLVKGFINRNNIDMEEYKDVKYRSFNEFFIREINEGSRPLPDSDDDLAAPSDGKLTAYPITAGSVFNIKHSVYSVDDLLEDKELAAEFEDGVCLVFRLTPDDYHRYSYIDDGQILHRKRIDGKLHTVRPIAFQTRGVFCQNTREYEVMLTRSFGKVVQMEVGALFVGKISNYCNGPDVRRGDEKGMFQFGGSTVIMLFQKDKITVDGVIYENTLMNNETIVKMGNKIGERSS